MFGVVIPLYIVSFENGDERVVALSTVALCLGELLMMFSANYIIDRLGYVRCIYVAGVTFAVR